ncbi:MAG: hypothetical protein WB992_12940 [Bryobacteraceae bacterium]
MRRFQPAILLISAYALFLLAGILTLPLRISEVLQLIGSFQFSFSGLIGWIAQTPASAPLHYFVQLPFVLIGGYSRIAARLPSLLFALGSCYLFLQLARRIPLRRPYLALLLFMLVPLHYRFATQGRPFEQALFLTLLAAIWFLRLIETPDYRISAIYAALLVLCLYTDASSYLPSVGYLLFLLRFVHDPKLRRAVWFALPATVIPGLLFLPYYFWAQPQANPNWIFERNAFSPDLPVYLQALHGLGGGGWNGYVAGSLLLLGILGGAWATFRPANSFTSTPMTLFCLFGGVVSTIAIPIAADTWNLLPFAASQALWAVPGMIILFFNALDWLPQRQMSGPLMTALATLLILLCALGDAAYLGYRREDMQAVAALVRPELKGDSCVVFVSEKLSKSLFILFDPELDKHECMTFFHPRVILASHPYVRPDQQEDAESYFRGLNFKETKRVREGGGEIVVMEQSK